MAVKLNKIQGVIFDLDGTLYPIKYMAFHMVKKQIFHFGKLMGFRRAQEKARGIEFANKQALYNALFVEHGKHIEQRVNKAMTWYENNYYPTFVNIIEQYYKPYPLAVDVLVELRKKTINCGLVSDYARIPERLSALGISEDLFDIRLSGEEEAALKPSPKCFNHIANVWGVAPESILVVGDKLTTDEQAAKAAGMPFFLIQSDKSWQNLKNLIADL